MSWLNVLSNARNVFKKTQPIEKPISTEPTTPAEPVDGSIALTLADGGTSLRRLRRHWKSIKERWPESQVSNADRWGMLCSVQKGKGSCKCLVCQRKFDSWEEGRDHECEHEKEFRRITGRFKPRRSNTKKDRPSDTPPGSPGPGPGVSTHRMGVVENSRGDNTNPGGSPPGGKG
jgi:hypothetical protein